MELYKIASIAKTLYEEMMAIEIENCRSEWQYSLYYAIINALNETEIELFWQEQYSQWNLNHLFRGQKNTLSQLHPSLNVALELIEQEVSGVKINGSFIEPNQANENFDFVLKEDYFSPLEVIRDNGRRILFDGERFSILDSILEFQEVARPIPEPAQNLIVGKLKSLMDLLGPIRQVYSNQDEIGRNYLETVVGASIFYLPHPVNECFSGYCSINALNEKISGRRVVREHITPRKYAAREVLNNNYDLADFFNDFTERFRRFMYLTPKENMKTVNYTEATHDEALQNLDITKFPAFESPFANDHRLFMNFISFCRENITEEEPLNLISATALLDQFLSIIQN